MYVPEGNLLNVVSVSGRGREEGNAGFRTVWNHWLVVGKVGRSSAKAGIMRNEIVTIIIRERIYIVAG